MSKLIIANWKSQKTREGLVGWWDEFISEYEPSEGCLVAIAPPFTLLSQLREFAKPIDTIKLAAQDVSPYPMGSYTGAVNAEQLNDLHVKYVLVGHSERRRHFHETPEDVARKVREVCNAGMTPVLCLDKEYIAEQAQALGSGFCDSCVIAYEPLSAIGSGKNEDVGSVQEVISQIKLSFGDDVAVIYGGSVTPENVGEYALVCDGALVGGASLDGKKFAELVAKVE
jgi:triosephosphate isomerase (TIM)